MESDRLVYIQYGRPEISTVQYSKRMANLLCTLHHLSAEMVLYLQVWNSAYSAGIWQQKKKAGGQHRRHKVPPFPVVRASLGVCQILLDKSCDLPTLKIICQVKKQSISKSLIFLTW